MASRTAEKRRATWDRSFCVVAGGAATVTSTSRPVQNIMRVLGRKAGETKRGRFAPASLTREARTLETKRPACSAAGRRNGPIFSAVAGSVRLLELKTQRFQAFFVFFRGSLFSFQRLDQAFARLFPVLLLVSEAQHRCHTPVPPPGGGVIREVVDGLLEFRNRLLLEPGQSHWQNLRLVIFRGDPVALIRGQILAC